MYLKYITQMIIFIIVFIVILLHILIIYNFTEHHEHATFNVPPDKMLIVTNMIHNDNMKPEKITATSLNANTINTEDINMTKIIVKNKLTFNNSQRCNWLQTPFMSMINGGDSLDQLERLLARPDNKLVCKDNEYMSGIKLEWKDPNTQRIIVKCCPIGVANENIQTRPDEGISGWSGS